METITDHPFTKRLVYPDGKLPAKILDTCGWMLDARINSTTDDPVYCPGLKSDHEFSRAEGGR